MTTDKPEACTERSESARSQKSGVIIYLFFILNFISCILASASFAQDNVKESLSELSRMLPAKKAVATSWGRDPFIPLVGDRIVSHVSLRLTAIIYNERSPSAIVNGKILYIGDSIEGQKLIDITKQYVILRGDGSTYKLEVGNTAGKSDDAEKTK